MVVTLVVVPTVALLVFAGRPGPSAGQRIVLEVGGSPTAAELASALKDEGLVSSELLMSLYLHLAGELHVVPGQHLIPGGSTPSEVRAFLLRSDSRPSAKVTIPEGWNRHQIAARLESSGVVPAAAFLSATANAELLRTLDVPGRDGRSPRTAEGYLFPATYDLKLDSAPDEIVARMVRESTTRWARILESAGSNGRGAAELGWGRAELVTLASMIEKEAAVEDERATISSVFYNRLLSPTFRPKLLQSDPTSAYGCLETPESPGCARFTGKVLPEMNRDPANAYSTYTHEGLPPGPIANPGEKSLMAALVPAETQFLFFVAKGGGRHTFTSTLAEHNHAIEGP